MMEASIADMARMLGGPELAVLHHGLDPAALEVEIVFVDDAWFDDDDGVVVTTTDDVIQLDRSSRFHSVYLAVALLVVAGASLLTG